MRYVYIDEFDTQNGDGIRVVLWTQGCMFHCEGCHNKDFWSFDGGNEFTDDTTRYILYLLDKDIKKDFSILGGEPLAPQNRKGITDLVKEIKFNRPETSIWLWTGYRFDDVRYLECMKYIDVLIDGQWKKELYDPKLKWRGSSNQRIIDVKKSLENDDIVLCLEQYE